MLTAKHTPLPASADTCIIGGGPAGLATAIALTQRGINPTVLDCGEPPIDKACGEALLPGTLASLNRLGVTLQTCSGHRIEGIGFTDESAGRAYARFHHGCGLGLRRTALHEALVRRALELGIACHWNAKQIDLVSEGVLVNEHLIAAPWVIAADGQNSRTREHAALGKTTTLKQRFGFRRHYQVAPWLPSIEIFWGADFQIYVTPVGAEEVGVAVLTSDPAQRVEQALEAVPDLAEYFAGARVTSDERGALTATRTLVDVQRGHLALVGDASGSVDAITGEGLCLAFEQALALAAAIERGSLEHYAEQHRILYRRQRFMSSLLLFLSDHGTLRNAAFKGLARWPRIFDGLLAFHTGEDWKLVAGIWTSRAGSQTRSTEELASHTQALPIRPE